MIVKGNIVRIIIGDRAITCEVLKVKLPWDIEYVTLGRETYGHWKHSIDGGFVEKLAANHDAYRGIK